MSRPIAAVSPSDIESFDCPPAPVRAATATTATAAGAGTGAAGARMPRRLLGGLAALSVAGVASAFPGDGGLVPPAASAAAAFGGMLGFALVLAAAAAHRQLREN
jgi:peptidoglycan/LPS O-acetylase OafA/YrhL